MPRDLTDPLIEDTLRGLTDRLSALESRPTLVIPTPLVPRPVNEFPSADWYQPTTSGTFENLWECIASRWSGLGVWVRVPWRTPASTVGELRVERILGGSTSSAVNLPAGGNGVQTFRWLHGGTLWGEGDGIFVSARRLSGAGSVEIGHPDVAVVDPADCTSAGV